jgi:hypothetical protein
LLASDEKATIPAFALILARRLELSAWLPSPATLTRRVSAAADRRRCPAAFVSRHEAGRARAEGDEAASP